MTRSRDRQTTQVSRRDGARRSRRSRAPLVLLKLGGELLEDPERLRVMAAAIARLGRGRRLIVVHGGGRDIDRDMAQHGIQKRTADGLRITDQATLDIVVGVLAGRVNTRVVAAATAAGTRAVGLTGADAGVGRVRRAPPYQAADGSRVDLGFVGQPVANGRPALLVALCNAGYVPIVACIGADARGRLYNVNADTFAGHLAVRLRAAHFIVAGATPGVLDAAGETIPKIDDATLDRLITSGEASAGMVTKLLACRAARRGGVSCVTIVDGRQPSRLERVLRQAQHALRQARPEPRSSFDQAQDDRSRKAQHAQSVPKGAPATSVIAGGQHKVGRAPANRTGH